MTTSASIAAGVALVGALLAAIYLPSRAKAEPADEAARCPRRRSPETGHTRPRTARALAKFRARASAWQIKASSIAAVGVSPGRVMERDR